MKHNSPNINVTPPTTTYIWKRQDISGSFVSTYSTKLFPSSEMCIGCLWNWAMTTSSERPNFRMFTQITAVSINLTERIFKKKCNSKTRFISICSTPHSFPVLVVPSLFLFLFFTVLHFWYQSLHLLQSLHSIYGLSFVSLSVSHALPTHLWS